MFNLTKRAVEALETRDTDYFVWDKELAGFGIRVMPSGCKSYLVQYRAGGRTRRKSIGRHGVLTADQARTEARILLGEVARGGNPSEDRQKALRAPTMATLCDRFLTEYVAHHCKPATQSNYEILLRLYIKPRLGPLKIADVNREDIVAFHHHHRDRPYMANRAVSVLSKLFNLAEDWGLRQAGSNPALRIQKFREEEKKRYLSDEEQTRLGRVLEDALKSGDENLYSVSAIRLLMLTGCRRGEILSLKWSYVTPHHLELPDSKTGRRRIPLPRVAHDILMSLPRRENNPYVILGNSEDGHLINLSKPWRRLRKRAGLENVRIHDLRHTYASVAVMSGIDPFMLKEILGHKDLSTTLRYSHFADEAVQRAAGSVADRLASAFGAGATGASPQLRVVY